MLYNEYELQWMLKATDQMREQNEAVISEMTTLPEEFQGCDNKEKMEALNNIEFASNLTNKLMEDLNEVTRAEFVSLDPDHQGELLVLCSELHTAWNQEFADTQSTNTQDILDAYYLLGNIEGRLKSGRVTMGDLGMLDAWKEEMDNK